MSRVVVIGGGIAGLATCYHILQEAGAAGRKIDITLIDKGERPGGNIRTERAWGFLVEGGPDCFLSEKPWALQLCRRLGLDSSILPTSRPRGKTYVFSRGKLHLLPEGVILMVPTKMIPLLTSSLLTVRGKLRMAVEPFIPKRKEKGDESLGDFVTRRLGREALDKIAEPLVAGVHAGDPDTMSIRSSFPKFVELEEQYGSLVRGMVARMATIKKKSARGATGDATGSPSSKPAMTMFVTLKNGLGELVDKILGEIKPVEILSKTSVSDMVETNGGYRVTTDTGRVIDAAAVVVATPAYISAQLVRKIDKELSAKLLTIPYASTATISIGYNKKDIKHPMDGFGFVVPGSEDRGIMAASWSSVKWAGRAPDDKVLIRCFVGGARRGHLVELDDKEMTHMVRAELKAIMGIDAKPVIVKIFRWRKAMPQYTIGHTGRVAEIKALTEKHPGLYLTGSAYHGIGISDTTREAEATAKKVVGALR
ncbi:Protoporphyrinogen IX oxidase, aerobic, HemY [hydrothermal vent metagenome]|uniref:Protoporphyrinogen IX oxidase, aerobic, HemY n=1 Tax=hydrothermal vent metagenome TaxID=652676 RepID=A0A3B0V6P4_9ZZZZ